MSDVSPAKKFIPFKFYVRTNEDSGKRWIFLLGVAPIYAFNWMTDEMPANYWPKSMNAINSKSVSADDTP